MQARYRTAVREVRGELGREVTVLIGGREVRAGESFEKRSPVNQEWLLARFQGGGAYYLHQYMREQTRTIIR